MAVVCMLSISQWCHWGFVIWFVPMPCFLLHDHLFPQLSLRQLPERMSLWFWHFSELLVYPHGGHVCSVDPACSVFQLRLCYVCSAGIYELPCGAIILSSAWLCHTVYIWSFARPPPIDGVKRHATWRGTPPPQSEKDRSQIERVFYIMSSIMLPQWFT